MHVNHIHQDTINNNSNYLNIDKSYIFFNSAKSIVRCINVMWNNPWKTQLIQFPVHPAAM